MEIDPLPPNSALSRLAWQPQVVSPAAESDAFWQMRRHIVGTLFRQTLRTARLRLALVLLLSGLLWVTLFWLCWKGFSFLDTAIASPDLHDRTVQAVFGVFFLSLMAMLVFSSAVILYSSLYRGRDVPLLLSLPTSAERVFIHKFQEAAVLSSWAFVLLASPMLLASGIVQHAPWYYFVLLLPLLVAFTYVPAALGAIAAMMIVRWLPGRRLLAGAVPLVLAVAAIVWLVASLVSQTEANFLTADWFHEMIKRLRVTDYRWLPSWWLTSGLFAAARREATDAVMFLAVLISNALLLRQVAVAVAERLYRAGYDRLHSRRAPPRQARYRWVDTAVNAAAWPLPRPTRLFLVKDYRLFRRDPVQWSQSLIFLGLLALYFVNIRRLTYDSSQVGWINLISFLNVFVVGLLLSTFTTRFIFPTISLEVARFWILGLVPLDRKTLLWSKVVFALSGSLLPCGALVLLSDTMLQVPLLVVAAHQLTSLLLCFGLAGLAVGLGARWPSLNEQSPARIAAGFGGTLNLVLSTLYIVAIVVLAALPSHISLAARSSYTAELLAERLRLASRLPTSISVGMLAATALGVLATWLPLRLGHRALEKMEF